MESNLIVKELLAKMEVENDLVIRNALQNNDFSTYRDTVRILQNTSILLEWNIVQGEHSDEGYI